MKIQEAIEKTDELMPNQYTTAQKVSWLSTLDGKIWHEVIMTHHGHQMEWYPFEGYTDDEAELLVPVPYADDVYGWYLKSRIALENNEVSKYDQYSAMFNQAYDEFTAWYNRTHPPITRGRWRL